MLLSNFYKDTIAGREVDDYFRFCGFDHPNHACSQIMRGINSIKRGPEWFRQISILF